MTSRQSKSFKRPLTPQMWLTMDLLDELDNLEAEVYRDRDYTLANEMLDALRNDHPR